MRANVDTSLRAFLLAAAAVVALNPANAAAATGPCAGLSGAAARKTAAALPAGDVRAIGCLEHAADVLSGRARFDVLVDLAMAYMDAGQPHASTAALLRAHQAAPDEAAAKDALDAITLPAVYVVRDKRQPLVKRCMFARYVVQRGTSAEDRAVARPFLAKHCDAASRDAAKAPCDRRTGTLALVAGIRRSRAGKHAPARVCFAAAMQDSEMRARAQYETGASYEREGRRAAAVDAYTSGQAAVSDAPRRERRALKRVLNKRLEYLAYAALKDGSLTPAQRCLASVRAIRALDADARHGPIVAYSKACENVQKERRAAPRRATPRRTAQRRAVRRSPRPPPKPALPIDEGVMLDLTGGLAISPNAGAGFSMVVDVGLLLGHFGLYATAQGDLFDGGKEVGSIDDSALGAAIGLMYRTPLSTTAILELGAAGGFWGRNRRRVTEVGVDDQRNPTVEEWEHLERQTANLRFGASLVFKSDLTLRALAVVGDYTSVGVTIGFRFKKTSMKRQR